MILNQGYQRVRSGKYIDPSCLEDHEIFRKNNAQIYLYIHEVGQIERQGSLLGNHPSVHHHSSLYQAPCRMLILPGKEHLWERMYQHQRGMNRRNIPECHLHQKESFSMLVAGYEIFLSYYQSCYTQLEHVLKL